MYSISSFIFPLPLGYLELSVRSFLRLLGLGHFLQKTTLFHQAHDRLRWLSTLAHPLACLLLFKVDTGRILIRIVGSDSIEEPSIPGRPGVGHDNAVKGPFFCTESR
jgi:hypothetical protein